MLRGGRSCSVGRLPGKDPRRGDKPAAGYRAVRSGSPACLGWSIPAEAPRREPAQCLTNCWGFCRKVGGGRGSGRAAAGLLNKGKAWGLIPKTKWEAIRGVIK